MKHERTKTEVISCVSDGKQIMFHTWQPSFYSWKYKPCDLNFSLEGRIRQREARTVVQTNKHIRHHIDT